MINKIDSLPPPRPHVTPQASTAPSARAKAPPTQIHPAQSVLALARSELGMDATEFSDMFFNDSSIGETSENIGFTLSPMARDRAGRNPGRGEPARPRNMLQRLAKQVASVSADQLEELRLSVPSIEAVEEVDDLLNRMRQQQLDSGEMALLLATLLNQNDLSGARRRRLELALDRVLEDEDWALLLFSRLEFGSMGKANLSELRRLYQRAASRQPSLVHWFAQFRQLDDRQRKLKTLIRALAFELSAEGGASDIRLAAVITDLKRILQFLAMGDHCQRMATVLALPTLDGDRLIEELVEIIQQSWVYTDWLADRAAQLLPNGQSQYGYARRMAELVKLLPEECFEDIDQRETILLAFVEYLERLADQE